ncbi:MULTISPECIES: lipopolysaccharide biosynthesis protein [unclassified Lysobacter]
MAWLFLHASVAAVGTWLARRYALQRDLVDHPGERRSHHVATPRGGGIAIVAALLVASAALAFRDPAYRTLLAAFASGLVLVAGVGLVDDHRPLSPWLRLAVHGLAAVLFAIAVQLTSGNPWAGVAALVLVMVLTNVWNFMDGINGLAASQAVLLAVVVALLLGGVWGLLAAALAAACLGFVPYNFPRARIFLGDVGSGAIGFSIAALVAVGVARIGTHAGWLLLPLSAFLVDAGLTLLRRVLRGERWWVPHTQHAYQVWARRDGHVMVTLAYAGWTIIAGIAVVVMFGTSTMVLLCSCAAWYTSAAFAWWVLQRIESAAPMSTQKDRE